ncbi:MAG: AAA family ATPase, partial [Eubacteriales bacterium]|nr:AAA family ATPase [Eubacteriales bacterium]
MLTNLHVKNLALIDEEDITFEKGLNILSGETGAGKSIVLGSINTALGNKTSSDLIRKGADYALTELTFHVDDKDKLLQLKQMGIEELEDGDIIISRKITPARSQIKVNGQLFTAGQTKNAAAVLLDIHGQHDSQLLMNEKKHLDIIDSYGAEKITSLKEKMKSAYDIYVKIKKRLEDTDIDEEAKNREISFAEYEVNEIEAANLGLNEDEHLEEAYKKMSNYQKIVEELGAAERMLVSDSDNISDMSGQILKLLITAAEYDGKLSDAADSMAAVEDLIRDVSRSISAYMEDCSFNQSEFNDIEQRLDQINNLKMKYGKTIEQILEYCQQKKQKLEEYE